jgi:S-adenosylmethionine synthetase
MTQIMRHHAEVAGYHLITTHENCFDSIRMNATKSGIKQGSQHVVDVFASHKINIYKANANDFKITLNGATALEDLEELCFVLSEAIGHKTSKEEIE